MGHSWCSLFGQTYRQRIKSHCACIQLKSCSSKRHNTEIGRFLISPKSWSNPEKQTKELHRHRQSALLYLLQIKSKVTFLQHDLTLSLFSHLWLQDSPRFAFDLRPFLHHRLRGSSGLLEQVAHLPASSALQRHECSRLGRKCEAQRCRRHRATLSSLSSCCLQRIFSSKHRGWSMFLTPGEEEVLLSVCEGPTYTTTTPHHTMRKCCSFLDCGALS